MASFMEIRNAVRVCALCREGRQEPDVQAVLRSSSSKKYRRHYHQKQQRR